MHHLHIIPCTHTHTHTSHHPLIPSQFLPLRSESSTSPTVSREDIRDGDSEEERGSGEYYSGEEFPEDDIMLARDRYRKISRSELDDNKFTIYRMQIIFLPLFLRLAKPDKHDAEDDAALEVLSDDHLDVFYNDDQQPIYQTDRRSPRRWFLPSPQSNLGFFQSQVLNLE